MQKTTLRWLFAAAAGSAVLAACGGGGGNDRVPEPVPAPPPVTTGVPASAQASVSGLIDYINSLISGSTNDTSEPVLIGDAVVPVDDTTEPAP